MFGGILTHNAARDQIPRKNKEGGDSDKTAFEERRSHVVEHDAYDGECA